MNIGKSNAGFTLIEILIAIAILSFMALGVFQIVSQSTDTAEKVTIEDEEFVQIVSALKKFERDFSSIYSPLYFSPPMGTAEENENPDDNYAEADKLPINQKYKDHNLFDGTTEDGHPIPAIFYEKNTEIIFFSSPIKENMKTRKSLFLAGFDTLLRQILTTASLKSFTGKRLEKTFSQQILIGEIHLLSHF